MDACLEENGKQPVDKVAFPLFPERFWRICDGDRQEFYAEFLRNQPSYVAWEPHKNHGGTYFGRLIGFGVDHKTRRFPALGRVQDARQGRQPDRAHHPAPQAERRDEAERRADNGRQCTSIRSATPTLSGQPSFPCLQHIAFDPDVKAGTLAMSAFYATQKLFVKAFGNWLGSVPPRLVRCRAVRPQASRGSTASSASRRWTTPRRRGELRDTLIRAARAVMGQPANPSIWRRPMPAERNGSASRRSSTADSRAYSGRPTRPTFRAAEADGRLRHLLAVRRRAPARLLRRIEGRPPPWTDDEIIGGLQVHQRLSGLGPRQPVPHPPRHLPR